MSAAVANLKGSKIHARRKIAKSEKKKIKIKMIVSTQKQRPRMHTDFSQAYAREKCMHEASQQKRIECS